MIRLTMSLSLTRTLNDYHRFAGARLLDVSSISEELQFLAFYPSRVINN